MTASRSLILVGLALAALAPGVAAKPALCKPTVTVTNKKPSAIFVTTLLYRVQGSDQVFRTGLAGKKLAHNQTEAWPSQRLAAASQGVVITSTAIEYRSCKGDRCGPVISNPAWFSHRFACRDSHHYNLTIE
jgi:hypothetical protein